MRVVGCKCSLFVSSSRLRAVAGRQNRLAARRQTSDVVYEWDPRKAAANLKKHRVAFSEAATVFLDPFALTFQDPDDSEGEQRYITVGESMSGRVILVAQR